MYFHYSIDILFIIILICLIDIYLSGFNDIKMVANYLLDESELNESFFQQIKQQFRNKKISITVSEAIDETEYLLSNDANERKLMESICNSKIEGGLQKVDLTDLKTQAGE